MIDHSSPASKYLITTRPETKFKKIDTECIKVVNIPLSNTVPYEKDDNIAAYLLSEKPDIIVLTSSLGSSLFFKYYSTYIKNTRFVAIGNATGKSIRENGYNAEIPEKQNSFGIIDLLKKYSSFKIALFRSNEANNIVTSFLETNHYNFKQFELYGIHKIYDTGLKGLLKSENCIGILLTSSIEATIFHELVGNIENKEIYSIGEITSQTLKDLGYRINLTGHSNFSEIVMEIDKKHCK
ncbi:MAG: uroporphyrinogen-III synthase [Ferroplasma sp.]